MDKETGKFTISFADSETAPLSFDKKAISIGRLKNCDVVLDHKAVSRKHAEIKLQGSRYSLANRSSSNVLTLNGRLLGTGKSDVLADGDIIQIGPFRIRATQNSGELALMVTRLSTADPRAEMPGVLSPETIAAIPEAADVLKVFWEKRTRDKEDWGTRLRPTEKPQPGKAVINWKPTRDLQRPWRFGLFLWAFLIIGAIGVFAFFKFPGTYAGKPLSNPHGADIEGSMIAVASNGNSCTTCHMPNEPIINACISCHQAEGFHSSNTKAHEDAGINCTTCHVEHQGSDFQLAEAAVRGCAECHSDNNPRTYNGRTVRTEHKGSLGYPVEDGKWTWVGIHREIAETIPGIRASATRDETEQARLSREFHIIHVARLQAPAGMAADGDGRVSCSSCHKSFDPLDRETPRSTCASCHSNSESAAAVNGQTANCISCHVQHPFSTNRWNEFLKEEAVAHRRNAMNSQIKQLNEK